MTMHLKKLTPPPPPPKKEDILMGPDLPILDKINIRVAASICNLRKSYQKLHHSQNKTNWISLLNNY